MRVRCDTSMRRSKEHTNGIDEFGITEWKCKGDCSNCICGIVMDDYGNERHVNLRRKENKSAEIHYTTQANNEEEQ